MAAFELLNDSERYKKYLVLTSIIIKERKKYSRLLKFILYPLIFSAIGFVLTFSILFFIFLCLFLYAYISVYKTLDEICLAEAKISVLDGFLELSFESNEMCESLMNAIKEDNWDEIFPLYILKKYKEGKSIA